MTMITAATAATTTSTDRYTIHTGLITRSR